MIELFLILLFIAAAILVKMRIELEKIDDVKYAMNNFAVEAARLVKTIDHFTPAMVAALSLGGQTIDGYIYADTDTGTLCLVNKKLRWKLVKGHEILDVAIVTDDTSQKTSKDYVEHVHVIMHLNDLKYHTVRINCLPVRAKKNSSSYQQALATATQWHGMLQYLKQAEEEYRFN
ncbi:MAG: hypothetical protein E6713_16560 [Sporomusaceae bacterium]|nr:hypothetical protein [Sporomusaceae bacterium]